MTIIKIRYTSGPCKGEALEKRDLQPAFFRGAMDAHQGREKHNTYKMKCHRIAYLKGYLRVRNGSIVVEESQ